MAVRRRLRDPTETRPEPASGWPSRSVRLRSSEMLPKPSIRSAWAKARSCSSRGRETGWRSSVTGSIGGAGIEQGVAAGEVGGDGREEITAVERRRRLVEAEVGVADVDGLDRAAEDVDRGREQAVVGADEQVPLAGRPDGDGAARAADARVDDRQVDADRCVRNRVGEDGGGLADVVAADPVADVDDVGAGRDARDHGTADAGEIVGNPVVRQEGDRKPHSLGVHCRWSICCGGLTRSRAGRSPASRAVIRRRPAGRRRGRRDRAGSPPPRP